MRTNKLTFFVSLLVAILCLGLYFIFTFVCQCEICQDIFMAIFSSSIFVIATSFIGYLVERYKVKRDCVDKFYEIKYEIEIACSYRDGGDGVSVEELSRIFKKIRSNYYGLYNLTAHYYVDCFVKKLNSNTLKLINCIEQCYNDLGNIENQILLKSNDESFLKHSIEKIFNSLSKSNDLIFNWLVIQKAVAYDKQKIKVAKVKFNESN
ncbi:MAG: hypothetical protein K2O44_06070 [Clostridia bacterium]|nr:hypothetical protein [Clostridia bacterium]